MAVSLARRIRRIGLLPTTKDEKGFRVRNVDPAITAEDRAAVEKQLRAAAKQRRLIAFPQKAKPVLKKAA